ncbi:hypothetical protein DSOUD_0802 [Desulfuromonas soudanensis]|uniref:Uncharacterized protein n=1 Tax=Desulfuromonas soudanensis TaxID=1603606 RepID=A0A0M3QF47_9BACT|nr:hypothetical protein [Desulfuromonas soudanensis]ALC15589.1 hypothetical protein DSOUD_0802 [Desulfuromonas soudanensis]
MKILILALFLTLGALPAGAKTYEVISIQNGNAEIRDTDKHKLFKVKPGAPLEDGWTVVTVDKDAVIIEKWLNDEERIRGVLPARIQKEKKR